MLHHVTREIPPDALDECIAFYELIGFRQVDPPPGIAGRAVWLEQGGGSRSQIHLMPAEEASPGSGHIGVVCRDLRGVLARLSQERSAAECERHPVQERRRHWGAPRVYVRDPAGHLVELMAWPPHEAPDEPGA